MIRRPSLLALAVAFVAAVALGPTAHAAEMVFHVDPEATQVTFDLPATGHDVHGRFLAAGGELRFDPDTGAASGRLTVDLKGAETGNGSRDQTMHGKVLESERFPVAEFAPSRIEGRVAASGPSEVKLVGRLTLHGAAHDVTLPAKVRVDGGRATAETSFPVPFIAWGMKDPSLLFLRVADTVRVSIAAAGDLAPATTATAQTEGRSPADGR